MRGAAPLCIQGARSRRLRPAWSFRLALELTGTGWIGLALAGGGTGTNDERSSMNDRPGMEVRFEPAGLQSPGQPRAGIVRLEAAHATPHDGVELTLLAGSTRFERVGSGLFERHVQTFGAQQEIARLRVPPGVLAPGVWERSLELVVPADAQGNERDPRDRVDYLLDVRAHFPGAPSRRARAQLPSRTSFAHEPPLAPEVRIARWRAAAASLRSGGLSELLLDEASERLSFQVGDVRAVVGRGAHPTRGTGLRGELWWPPLGLGLHVDERHPSDPASTWSRLDPALRDRFRLEARDQVQSTRFLEGELGHALTAFQDATLDDAGATVWHRSDTPSGWTRFLGRTYELAKRVYVASEQVLPPPELATALDSYRRFARRWDSRVQVGDGSVQVPVAPGCVLTLAHAFAGNRLTHSILWTPLPASADRGAWAKAAARTGAELVLEPHRLGLQVPLVRDPESIWALARQLDSLLEPLRLRPLASPYR